VPERVSVESSAALFADTMFAPGANRSMTEPVLENDAIASVLSLAPTVIASVTRAGERVPASSPPLPAATT